MLRHPAVPRCPAMPPCLRQKLGVLIHISLLLALAAPPLEPRISALVWIRRAANNAEDSHPWAEVLKNGQIVELDGSRAGEDSGNRGDRLFLEDSEDIVRSNIVNISRMVDHNSISLVVNSKNMLACPSSDPPIYSARSKT